MPPKSPYMYTVHGKLSDRESFDRRRCMCAVQDRPSRAIITFVSTAYTEKIIEMAEKDPHHFRIGNQPLTKNGSQGSSSSISLFSISQSMERNSSGQKKVHWRKAQLKLEKNVFREHKAKLASGDVKVSTADLRGQGRNGRMLRSIYWATKADGSKSRRDWLSILYAEVHERCWWWNGAMLWRRSFVGRFLELFALAS